MQSPATGAETITVQGVTIPRIGFGTWEVTGSDVRDAVEDAIGLGYRHIDTARAYGNERDVGAGITASGIERSEIFVTTKLWFDALDPKGVRQQLESSLGDLGLDHVDLLLIHWPNPDFPVGGTLETMCELRDEGRVGSLGVSNFPTVELGEAKEASSAPLICDQVEYHAFLDQSKLLRMLRENDMALTAYSPLAGGEVAASAELREIGDAHGKSAVQVGLRWLLDQDNVVVIPRSSSHENRRANLELFDFELSPDQRDTIDALPKDHRTITPSFAPHWD